MRIEQTVEIPSNRRLLVEVPPEVPVGKVVLTFTPASVDEYIESAEAIWAANRAHPEELKAKLHALQGCLEGSAFGGMDGITYQRKVRKEWDN
jgi:hypothetical protein